MLNWPLVQDGVTITGTSATTADITIVYRADTKSQNSNYPLAFEFFLSGSTGADGFYIGSTVHTVIDDSTRFQTAMLTGVSIANLPLGSVVATLTDGTSSEFSAPATTIVG